MNLPSRAYCLQWRHKRNNSIRKYYTAEFCRGEILSEPNDWILNFNSFRQKFYLWDDKLRRNLWIGKILRMNLFDRLVLSHLPNFISLRFLRVTREKCTDTNASANRWESRWITVKGRFTFWWNLSILKAARLKIIYAIGRFGLISWSDFSFTPTLLEISFKFLWIVDKLHPMVKTLNVLKVEVNLLERME